MYDPIKMTFSIPEKKKVIHLTHRENLLLYYLYKHKNEVVTFNDLCKYMLGRKMEYDEYKIVVTCKSRVCRKLKKEIIIINYNKVGYMLTKLGTE